MDTAIGLIGVPRDIDNVAPVSTSIWYNFGGEVSAKSKNRSWIGTAWKIRKRVKSFFQIAINNPTNLDRIIHIRPPPS